MSYGKLVMNGRSLYEYPPGRISFLPFQTYFYSPVIVRLEDELGPVKELFAGKSYRFHAVNYYGRSGYLEQKEGNFTWSNTPTNFRVLDMVGNNTLITDNFGSLSLLPPEVYRRKVPPTTGNPSYSLGTPVQPASVQPASVQPASVQPVSVTQSSIPVCSGDTFGPCPLGYDCVKLPNGYTCQTPLPNCSGSCGGKCPGNCPRGLICRVNAQGNGYECVSQVNTALPRFLIIFFSFLLLLLIIILCIYLCRDPEKDEFEELEI